MTPKDFSSPITADGEYSFPATIAAGNFCTYRLSGNFSGASVTPGYVSASGVFTALGSAVTAAATLGPYPLPVGPTPGNDTPGQATPALSVAGSVSPAIRLEIIEDRDRSPINADNIADALGFSPMPGTPEAFASVIQTDPEVVRAAMGAASSEEVTILAGLGAAAAGGARAATRNMVVTQVGDSNTDNVAGRPGWQIAFLAELAGNRGALAGCVHYNIGQNGSTLAAWKTASEAANTSPAPTVRNDPWAAVAANPDLIILSLGTNDLNSPSNRASIGVQSTFRANLDALVSFFLANTQAIVWLRMPQPFVHEDFLGVTQWVNEAEAAEASRIIRDAYKLWRTRHPRVLVYDSHKALFGNSIANKATEAQDPHGGGALMEDSLHPLNLGFRRIAQQMAEQWSGRFWRPLVTTSLPNELRMEAVASETVWMSGAASTTVMSVYTSPDEVLSGERSDSFTAPEFEAPRSEQAEIFRKTGRFGANLRIRNSGGAAQSVSMYFHASNRTLRCTSVGLSQAVTAGSKHYEQWTLTGLVDTAGSAATIVAGDVGPVSFYWREQRFAPFLGKNALNDVVINIPAGQTSAPGAIITSKAATYGMTSISAVKTDGNALTVEIRERNQVDARYVAGGANPTGGTFTTGKVIATIVFSAGYRKDPTITWNSDGYPSGYKLAGTGSWITADITSGTIGSGVLQVSVGWN